MAHLIKLELKKFGTARNIIFTFAAILFSILFITVSLHRLTRAHSPLSCAMDK